MIMLAIPAFAFWKFVLAPCWATMSQDPNQMAKAGEEGDTDNYLSKTQKKKEAKAKKYGQN